MNMRNTRLSLSIALATYNGSRYLVEQLESISHQSRLPDELIISDDVSVDGTQAIALDFAKDAPFPVRLVQNSERLGSSRNFESAIRACNGDIIFLCDQDDVWYPNKISLIEERFSDDLAVGAVFTDGDVVDRDLRSLEQGLWKSFRFNLEEQARVNAGDALGVLFKHPVVTGATMAFRSAYRDLVLPLPDTWHDAWIAMLIAATSCLAALPIPLIAYRQHGTNQLGVPHRGRNHGKTCAAIYEPRILFYEMAQGRLLQLGQSFPVGKQQMDRIEEMLVFLRARATLPHSILQRLPAALHELVALRYHRYAYGVSSFGKDLLR
jgi:hypothetical protein